jgi:hypothetical protein
MVYVAVGEAPFHSESIAWTTNRLIWGRQADAVDRGHGCLIYYSSASNYEILSGG